MNCEQCALDRNLCPNYLPREMQYPLLFVGQAPGKTEVITKSPFTGSAGKMLFSLCLSAALIKREIPQANLVLCKPPDDGKGNDRVPSSFEIQCCEDALKETIHAVQPELIVAFGTLPTKELTGLGPISSLHGSFHPLLPRWEHECQVLCCYHPSFVMRQRQQIPVAIKDLKLVHTFFTRGIEAKIKNDFIFDPGVEELINYLEQGRGRITDFDTETTGLNKRQDRVIGCSFSNSSTSACAVYFTDRDERISIIKEFLEDETFKKSTQNGSYDTEIVFNSMGIEIKGWAFDTMLAEQLLNSELSKDLDNLRAMYTNMESYKPSKKEMKNTQLWGKERMLLYAAKDALCTGLVRRAQEALLPPTQVKLMQETLIPASLALNKAERVGVNVDVNTLAIMYANVIPEAEAIKEEVQKASGINPASPKQVMTMFNLESSDREALEDLISKGHEQGELIKKILRYRDLTKGASTFLKGVYDRLEDGRIHTEYNPTGTRTGRLSSHNPNLQNIQEPFRVIYTSDPGCFLVTADYKQLELRVVSILAPCEILKFAFSSGVDVHSEVLELMKDNIPERLLWNARLVAKTVVFGTLFGRSARSIAIKFGVPVVTAESWQDVCFNRYPGLKKYWNDKMMDFRQRGFVTTPFGRKRYVQTFTQAVNTPVQSSANEVVLKALIRLDEAKFDIRLDTHDEIVVNVKKKELKRKAKLMKEIMEAPVPELDNERFPVKIKYGLNWLEMKEMEV